MWRKILILSVVPVLVLGGVVINDLELDGKVVYLRGVEVMQRDVSAFYPDSRLSEPVFDGALYVQKVLAEPVYFDIRLPRGMETLTVKVYAIGDVSNIKMGLRRMPVAGTDWNYDIQAPQVSSDGRYTVLTQSWSLADALVVAGKVRVLVSVPDLRDASLGLVIVELDGEPLGMRGLWTKLTEKIW